MTDEIRRLIDQAHVAVQELRDLLEAGASAEAVQEGCEFVAGTARAIAVLNDRPRLGSLGLTTGRPHATTKTS